MKKYLLIIPLLLALAINTHAGEQTINDLTALGTTLATGDYLVLWDTSGSVTRKVTYSNLMNFGISDDNTVQIDGSPNDDEYARFTANGLEGRTEAEFKADFNLEIGTDVQAYDAELAALAGLTSAADKGIQFTGSGTASTYDLTTFGKSIIDDANEAAFKATVNLEIGTDVLAQQTIGIADDNLLEVDGSPNDDEWCRFTANGLEGRTNAELISDASLADNDHDADHIDGGSDAIDGDKIEITWTPTYYTCSTTPSEADSVDDLTAHLFGIDIALNSLTAGAVDTSGTPVDNDFAKFTDANTIEGRSYQEATTDLLSSALAENTSIQLDPSLSADGTYSGTTITGTAGTDLDFGNLVYLASADTKWEKTDADAEATTKPLLGVVVAAASEDATATILLWGHIRADAAFPTLAVGSPVFAGVTLAAVSTTAPSGSGDCVRIVGWATTANSIMFKPDGTWIELN